MHSIGAGAATAPPRPAQGVAIDWYVFFAPRCGLCVRRDTSAPHVPVNGRGETRWPFGRPVSKKGREETSQAETDKGEVPEGVLTRNPEHMPRARPGRARHRACACAAWVQVSTRHGGAGQVVCGWSIFRLPRTDALLPRRLARPDGRL